MCFQEHDETCSDDFVVKGLVQEGAWGKVFAANRATDGQAVALVSIFEIPFHCYRNFLVTQKIVPTLLI